MGIINVDIVYNLMNTTDDDNRLIVNKNNIYKDTLYKIVADTILNMAITITPKQTGFLRSTGHVVKNSIGTYSVVFNAKYALYVHEIIDYRHRFPTQAKFLEDAGWIVTNILMDVLKFTFTMEYNNDGSIALHLDSISLKDFKTNASKLLHNISIVDSNDLKQLDNLDYIFIDGEEVKYNDTY